MGLQDAISDTGSINNRTVSTTDSVLDSEHQDAISADNWTINNSTASTTEGYATLITTTVNVLFFSGVFCPIE